MATSKGNDQRDPKSATAAVQPEAVPTKDTRVPTKRQRVRGRLSKPVYLIHDGKSTVTIPAVTEERVVTDESDPEFGNVVTETLVEEETRAIPLAKNSRYGSRKIGVAHEITDSAEAEALRGKGFRDATQEEIKASEAEVRKSGGGKTIDEIAAEQRQLAQANLRRTTRPGAHTREENE